MALRSKIHRDDVKTVSNVVTALASLVALLAAVAAASSLFWIGEGASSTFTTLRGETVQIFGQGIYRYDTIFIAAGFKGQDAVALILGVPLLVISIALYRRRAMRGHLLLLGALGYFLYLYASMALGSAYNPLFMLYIATFSASFFAFIRVFTSVNLDTVTAQIPAGLPRRSLAAFMFAAGTVTLLVWGGPLVESLLSGEPPDRLDSYTTMVTDALDLAIITPATFLCAVMTLRRDPMGYVIAIPLLSLIVLLAPQIILSTYFQQTAGVPFTTGEMIGPVTGFVVLGLIAIWLLVVILRSFSNHT